MSDAGLRASIWSGASGADWDGPGLSDAGVSSASAVNAGRRPPPGSVDSAGHNPQHNRSGSPPGLLVCLLVGAWLGQRPLTLERR